ncbi:MAG: DUF1427 family protein [Elusimicrobiota bacterium]|jgi:XapX domain-containing protein|nr:DUF1427 family protein [Elusimicrobiota bacterium]
MKMLILSTITGIIVGALFTFFKLPLPAPNALAGILGIAGMYLGYVIVNFLRG